MKTAAALWMGAALCASSAAGAAQVQGPPAAPVEEDAVTSADGQALARIVGGFSEFAGSEANVRSLAAGLRQGGEITLTAPNRAGQAGASVRFMPPTRPMAYGNIRIALALAREQLAQLGITQPTPAQIKAVLSGGAVTSRSDARGIPVLLPGVLPMYAYGMGWSRIAETMGLNLGYAMSGRTRSATTAALAADAAPAGIAGRSVPSALAPSPARTAVAPRSRAPASTPTGAASGVTRAAVAKPVGPVKRRVAAPPAPAAAASTAAQRAGSPAVEPAGTIDTTLRRAGPERSQESRSGSGAAGGAENTGAEPVAAAPVPSPRDEPVLATGQTPTETPGPGAGERGPEPSGPAE